MSGISFAASLVQIETTNTLFHVKSTYAPGKTLVTSAFSSAYTMNCTTVPDGVIGVDSASMKNIARMIKVVEDLHSRSERIGIVNSRLNTPPRC